VWGFQSAPPTLRTWSHCGKVQAKSASISRRLFQPGNIAFDLTAIMDAGKFVYEALVFIKAAGDVIKLLNEIAKILGKRHGENREAAGRPIFLIEYGRKCYPVTNEDDLRTVRAAIEGSAEPARGT
jgi:hypothetical protein